MSQRFDIAILGVDGLGGLGGHGGLLCSGDGDCIDWRDSSCFSESRTDNP